MTRTPARRPAEGRNALTARIELTEAIPVGYHGSMSAAFNHPGVFFVLLDGQAAGDFCVERGAEAWNVHSHVLKAFQGQGIASLIYDMVETEASHQGAILEPSPHQTEDAIAFWKHRKARPHSALSSAEEPHELPPLRVYDRLTHQEIDFAPKAFGPLLDIGLRLRARTRAAALDAGSPSPPSAPSD